MHKKTKTSTLGGGGQGAGGGGGGGSRYPLLTDLYILFLPHMAIVIISVPFHNIVYCKVLTPQQKAEYHGCSYASLS